MFDRIKKEIAHLFLLIIQLMSGQQWTLPSRQKAAGWTAL